MSKNIIFIETVKKLILLLTLQGCGELWSGLGNISLTLLISFMSSIYYGLRKG
jgi:hypothetical protein